MLSVAKGFITGFSSVPRELDSLKTNVFAGDGIQLRTEDKSFRYRRFVKTKALVPMGLLDFGSREFNSLVKTFRYRLV